MGAIGSMIPNIDPKTTIAVDALRCELRLYDFQLTALNGVPNHVRLGWWKQRRIYPLLSSLWQYWWGRIPFWKVVPLTVIPATTFSGFYRCRDVHTVFVFFNVYNPDDCRQFTQTLESLGVRSRPDLQAFTASHTAEEVEQWLGYFATMVRTPEEWRRLRPDVTAAPIRISQIQTGLRIDLATLGSLPLSGLKVVDFSKVVAGPYCGRLLSDLGADVLQVRNPNGVHVPMVDTYASTGKRSTFLDLTVDHDRDAARKLLAVADVVITSFPLLEQANRLGIGPDSMSERRPFIHLNVSAYPSDSRWAGRKGYAPMAAAASGLFYTAVGPEGLKAATTSTDATLWPCDGYPEDYFTGLLGCAAILAALHQRSQHGGSYLVETSLAAGCEWVATQSISVPTPLTAQQITSNFQDFEHCAKQLQRSSPTPWTGGSLSTIPSPISIPGFATLGLYTSVPVLGSSPPTFVPPFHGENDSQTTS